MQFLLNLKWKRLYFSKNVKKRVFLKFRLDFYGETCQHRFSGETDK